MAGVVRRSGGEERVEGMKMKINGKWKKEKGKRRSAAP
jgi:hypothetical protein